ncbi:MAG: hypothetical protein AAFX99_13820, partial [Myxococcota bacterium]
MRSQDDNKPNTHGPKEANSTALDHDPAKPDDVLKPVDPTAVSWIELMEQESIDAQENPAHALPDFDDVSLDFAMVDSLRTDPTTTAAPGPPNTTLTEDELEAISIDTASPEDELEALVNRSELLEQG